MRITTSFGNGIPEDHVGMLTGCIVFITHGVAWKVGV